MDSIDASASVAAAMEGSSGFSNELKASSAASALVPFSFRNAFHDALRDATRWFPIAGKRIRIDQAWQSDGRGGTALGFGASGNRVIELGCGPGLVGVVAGHLEPKSIVITDGDPASVALTQRNIKVNDLSEEVCTAEEYLWGELGHHLVSGNAHYDVILGADIVACPYASTFEALMVSLQEMAGPQTLVLLAYKKRQNSEEKFFEEFEKVFEIAQIDRSELHADFQEGGDIVIFKARLKHQS
ncbi:hypothetical protein PI124_g17591 [Phytophthora idaei]|nr:hypothetical protein PI124_g17591 [Phytophthora idaei]